MLSKVSTVFRNLARKVLDIDDTEVPKEQFELLSEFLTQAHYSLNTSSIQELMESMKRKHLVDSICISNKSGSLLISTEENEFNDALIGTAMMNYIKSELPKSETVLVKADDQWFILFPYNDKIYIIKAASDLTQVELKALAKEIEYYLAKQSAPHQ